MKLLILGGTTEASALARAVAQDPRIDATLSLAGRTRAPVAQPIATRVGGFGGVAGLAEYLRAHRVAAMIDATHPFAVKISGAAREAAALSDVPLLVLRRPPWQAGPGDVWTRVRTVAQAAGKLGDVPRRVFLTIGRQDLAPFALAHRHHYVIRSVDAPPAEDLPMGAEVIASRGPFTEADETALLRERRIEVLVTKNSGGSATVAKLGAARALAVPVVMIDRPAEDGAAVETVAEALAWLRQRTDSPRGV